MKLRALVIDDSRVMRNMVMESLRRTGLAEFEFSEATDGVDALSKFSSKTVDIIFADWNMPNMSGIELVRKIRAMGRTESIPIVMVTSEKTVGKVEEALDSAGANAFITKPFTIAYMQKKLTPLLEQIDRKRTEPTGGFFSKLVGGGN